MSDNVFRVLGPLGQQMAVGPTELCGTYRYPVGLTLKEIVIWYWGTRLVDITCGAVATAGASSAAFAPSVTNGPSADDGGTGLRRYLITFGRWSVQNEAVITGTASAASGFSLFLESDIAPNNFACAYDGVLWYPYIKVSGTVIAQDPSDPSISATVSWNSVLDESWGPGGPPNTANATIFGKNVLVGYEIIDEPGSAGSFIAPTMAFNSDWPYV